MTLITRTVQAMLEEAKTRLLPRTTDLALSAPERALCQEAINACDRGLAALQPDNTVVPGQRQARASDLRDKVFSLKTVDESHGFTDPAQLYDAMALIDDAASCILLGIPSYTSALGS